MLRRMRTLQRLFRRRSWAGLGPSCRSLTPDRVPGLGRRASAWLLLGLLGGLAVACQPAASDEDIAAQPQALAVTADSESEPIQPATSTEAELQSTDPLAAAPSGCWAERTCGARKYVCKRPDSPRPCGAAGCSELQFACSSDAGCLEGYRCALCKPGDPFPCSFATGLCKPAACASDRDCGSPNLVCQGGSCAHKTCRSSRSCRGYCVAGSCWNKAGWCHDTTLPPPP